VSYTETRYAQDVHPGEELAPLSIPIDLTTCTLLASATRDFHPLHHNRDYCQQVRKQKDAVVSGPMLQAFVARYLNEWAGPGWRLQKVWVRPRGSIFAGDTITLRGKVSKVTASYSQGIVEIEATIANQQGPQVLAGGTVTLPARK